MQKESRMALHPGVARRRFIDIGVADDEEDLSHKMSQQTLLEIQTTFKNEPNSRQLSQ